MASVAAEGVDDMVLVVDCREVASVVTEDADDDCVLTRMSRKMVVMQMKQWRNNRNMMQSLG